MGFESLEEILGFAAEKEKEAVTFYESLAMQAPNSGARELLEGFAAEEKKHLVMFENILSGDMELESYTYDWIPDMKRSNYMVETDYQEGMGYADLLRLAMKREENSLQMYNDLLNKVDREELKGVFKMLCQEEAGHKLKLETMYDDYMACQGD